MRSPVARSSGCCGDKKSPSGGIDRTGFFGYMVFRWTVNGENSRPGKSGSVM
jgi:hypothetical protein